MRLAVYFPPQVSIQARRGMPWRVPRWVLGSASLRLAIVAALGVTVGAAGCGTRSEPAAGTGLPSYQDVHLRVSILDHSPLADAMRIGLNEWEAKTGATLELVRGKTLDLSAELLVVSGYELEQLEDLPEIPQEVLSDRGVQLEDLPPVYRLRFMQRQGKTVAMPLGVDVVLLWYRADLFRDADIRSAFRKASGRELAPPETWQDFVTVAKFFQGSKWVKYGCALATDGASDCVRSYFVHGAAYCRGPNWSSFAIDSETAAPRLAEAGFVRVLKEWLEAVNASPAAGGNAVTESEARKTFLEGDAAMVICRIPPTVDPHEKREPRAKFQFAPAALPGAKTLYAPRGGKAEDRAEVNRCAHFASTGWYLVLGPQAGKPTKPAIDLLRFLASGEETYYLVTACRRGFVPVRPKLLLEPGRFLGYGLSVNTISQYFTLVSEALANEVWVADLRIPKAKELEQILAEELMKALKGGQSPEAALQAAANAWQQQIAPQQKLIVKRYRESLGLPALADE